MERFTKQYVDNYDEKMKSKDELRRDLRICSSILKNNHEIKEEMSVKIYDIGSRITKELFSRYGDNAMWSTKYINNLPDSSFLWIESGGSKDKQGKTTPRSLRHMPIKDSKGKIDLPHVRNALARINQVKDKDGNLLSKDRQEKMIAILKKYLEEQKQFSLPYYKGDRKEEWETPQELFDDLNSVYHFNLDPCSTDKNAKCKNHYTKKEDGLKQDWSGKRVFVNPPYTQAKAWAEKCLQESKKGATVVGLFNSRTDTKWFHEFVKGKAKFKFFSGRLKFEINGKALGPAAFPSILIVWNGELPQSEKLDKYFEYYDEFEDEDFGVQRLFGHPAGQMFQVANLKKFMPEHDVFCEPFAGSATLYFAKDATEKKAYLNDRGFYSQLLKSIKTLTNEEIKKLTKMNWTSSKAYFDRMRALKPKTKVEFIHKHVYLIRWAYGGSIHLNWNSHHDGKTTTHNKPERWMKVRDRLQNATITKMDYSEVIRKVDSPKTFFYIDPPYYKENDKRITKFNIGEIKLADFVSVLKGIKGKFIATIGNEKDWIDALKEAGFYIYLTNSKAGTPPQKANEKKKSLVVPFISNYPLTEKQKNNEKLDKDEAIESESFEDKKEIGIFICGSCGCTRQTEKKQDKSVICPNCGGEMNKAKSSFSLNYSEGITETFEVHSIDHIQMSAGNPNWLEMSGILFHRGNHKGIEYEDEVLKSARLVPREGENLCYVNFYHKKDEAHRIGIIGEIWWDDNATWYCPNNNIKGKGALMYRAFVTDKDAIYEIQNGKIGNVSAELHFDTYRKRTSASETEYAAHVEVNGQAITSSPALKAADIENICVIDEDGKRNCKSLRKGQVK